MSHQRLMILCAAILSLIVFGTMSVAMLSVAPVQASAAFTPAAGEHGALLVRADPFAVREDATTPTPTATVLSYVRLPLVIKQPTMTPTPTPTPTITPTPSPTPTRVGIYGRVTKGGAPVADVQVKLRSWTGRTYLDITSVTTDLDGWFAFTGIPSVPSGEQYSVYCGSPPGPDTLLMWQTRSLTAYSAGSTVHIGDFDIADVALIAPANNATMSLPAEFQWTPRPASPTDSYVWAIYNFSLNQWYWSPRLGYTGSYVRYSLPNGFNPGTQYTWYVQVHSPDGGYGFSREWRTVTFTGATGLSEGALSFTTWSGR